MKVGETSVERAIATGRVLPFAAAAVFLIVLVAPGLSILAQVALFVGEVAQRAERSRLSAVGEQGRPLVRRVRANVNPGGDGAVAHRVRFGGQAVQYRQ